MGDDITLKQVRMIMEQIARQSGRPLTTIEIGDVREVLGKGNNGTLGAYIKQIKFEYIENNAFEHHELAMEFKAAAMAEFNRLLDNRVKCLKEKSEAISRDNDELLKTIDRVDADNLTLRNELQTAHKEAVDRETQLRADLVETMRLLAASESAKSVLETDIAKVKIELTASHNEIMDMTARLAKAEAENDTLIDGRKEILDNLNRANKAREDADRAAALTAQAATHFQEMIDQLRRQYSALEEDVSVWKNRAVEFEKQRDEAWEKLLKVAEERLEDVKQGAKGAGGNKKEAPRPPKRHHQRGSRPQTNQPEA